MQIVGTPIAASGVSDGGLRTRRTSKRKKLLNQIGFFIGAARRGDAADRIRCHTGTGYGGIRWRYGQRLVPAHFAPRIGDLLADHRVEDAVLMGGIAPGEAALDAGMAAIGLAVLPRHHAHEFLAAHFRLERAADAAIGAGRDFRMFRLADLDHRLLGQRRGRAGLHAGAAGDAFGSQEILVHAGDTRLSKPRPSIVSAKVPCTSSQARTQREQTMHLEGS